MVRPEYLEINCKSAVHRVQGPYQPIEGRYRLTRGALSLLRDHANPVSLLTKSPMIVRDVDVLSELALSQRRGAPEPQAAVRRGQQLGLPL